MDGRGNNFSPLLARYLNAANDGNACSDFLATHLDCPRALPPSGPETLPEGGAHAGHSLGALPPFPLHLESSLPLPLWRLRDVVTRSDL